MNKVLEYVIRAKDATAGAVNSAIRRARSFAAASSGGFRGAADAAKRALPAITAVTASMGMMGGAAGRAAQAISGIASAALAFGPLGVAIAGAQMAMMHFMSSAQEAADRFRQKVADMAAHVQKRGEQIKNSIAASVQAGIDSACAAVERLNRGFDRLAQKRAGLQKAEAGRADAQGQSEILAMTRQMDAAVAGADDAERGRVAAAWRVRIAEKREEVVRRTADYEAKMAEQAIRDDEERLRIAEKAEKKYALAGDTARERYAVAKGAYGDDDPFTRRLKAQAEQAEGLEREAAERRRELRARLEVARADAEVGDMNRANRIASATNDVLAARDAHGMAEADYAKARAEEAAKAEAEARREEQSRIADEERLRVEMERRIADERIKLAKAELDERSREEVSAQTRLAAAQAKVRQAWGWYRDKDSLAAQLAEEKADAEAQRQYEKDFDRLRGRRRDWRTADDLSLDDEAVRRVALAKEEEAAAAKAVLETAENTARAADALEAIEAMFEEGGE